MAERRPMLTDPEVLEALAHPVRLDLLAYLMANGPASASTCARAVGDTPSNCSYHLRTLARHGLVERVESADRRQRPWRATITGFALEPHADPATPSGRGRRPSWRPRWRSSTVCADYLSHHDSVPAAWREVDLASSYTLRISPAELRVLGEQLDALIRPLIAAGREGAPADAELVEVLISTCSPAPRHHGAVRTPQRPRLPHSVGGGADLRHGRLAAAGGAPDRRVSGSPGRRRGPRWPSPPSWRRGSFWPHSAGGWLMPSTAGRP